MIARDPSMIVAAGEVVHGATCAHSVGGQCGHSCWLEVFHDEGEPGSGR
jgi:hypothetical protein